MENEQGFGIVANMKFDVLKKSKTNWHKTSAEANYC